MKNLLLIITAVFSLLMAPVSAFAQAAAGTWTSICAAGATIDESSMSKYAVSGAPATSLTMKAGATGNVVARYDVTNTAVPSTLLPAWTTLELGYTDTGNGGVSATLYLVNPCTGGTVQICKVSSIDNQNCGTCTFGAGIIDFQNLLYFVEVVLNRPAAEDPLPKATTLRIF